MPDRWRQGMTAEQRRQARARLEDWYADHGHDEDHQMRKLGSSACAIGSHTACDAEIPGGAGCPCECHDARADEMAALTSGFTGGAGAR